MLARLAPPLLVALVLALPAFGQTLLFDFETGPSDATPSSNPSAVVETGVNGIFAATSAAHGRELWATDTTGAGTQLLADLVPGVGSSDPRELTRRPGGRVLFTAETPQTGRELFASDGSALGTTLLVDLLPGAAGSRPTHLTVVGNRVFFVAYTPATGWELHVSDGTAQGTTRVVDLFPGPVGIVDDASATELVALNANEVLFVVRGLGWELWRSDGTAAGTTLVTQVSATVFGSWPPDRTTPYAGGVLFRATNFQGARVAWFTDGTAGGTTSLGVASTGGFVVAGANAFFVGDVPGSGHELHVTDGTLAGTALVLDTTPAPGESSEPELLGAVGGVLVLSTWEPGYVRRLYRSDGTPGGTTWISDLAPPPHPGDVRGHLHLGELWFATPDNGGALVRTDGTAPGTQLVASVEGVRELASLGGVLTFTATSDPEGDELWTSLGSAATTSLLLDATPPPANAGSEPELLGEFRNRALYAVRATGAATEQVWATDGTTAGTVLLTPDSEPDFPVGRTVFAATDLFCLFPATHASLGLEPHLSDGTPGGTTVLDLVPGSGGSPVLAAAAVGDRILFSSAAYGGGYELYATDGTLAGTSRIANIDPGPTSSSPDDFFVHDFGVGERLLFFASTPGTGKEPYVSSGFTTGTTRLADTVPGPAGNTNSVEFGAAGGFAVFPADDGAGGQVLWATDGTIPGTALIADLAPGPPLARLSEFQGFGQRVWFLAEIGGSTSLWSTDGTAGGTVPFLGLPGEPKSGLAPIDDRRAAVWAGGSTADELWVIDVVTFQPFLLASFEPNLHPFDLAYAAALGEEHLVLLARDAIAGTQAWTTDGTPGGTYALTDFPSADATPREFARAGDQLVLRADDGVHGAELFRLDLVAAGAWVAEPYGTGCPGTNGVVPRISLAGEARGSSASPFEVQVADARASSPAFLLWTRGPGAQSLPGCTLWLDGFLHVELASTDPTGAASLAVAPNPGLVGQRFDSQWFVLDPAGAAYGVASASQALEVVVGP